MAEPAKHFSVKDLAARWATSGATVRRILKDGSLAFIQIRRSIRIPIDEIERYEREQWVESSATLKISSINSATTSPTGRGSGTFAGQTAADQRKFQRASGTNGKRVLSNGNG